MAEQAWSAAIVNNSLWWEHRKIQSSPGFNQNLLLFLTHMCHMFTCIKSTQDSCLAVGPVAQKCKYPVMISDTWHLPHKMHSRSFSHSHCAFLPKGWTVLPWRAEARPGALILPFPCPHIPSPHLIWGPLVKPQGQWLPSKTHLVLLVWVVPGMREDFKLAGNGPL